MKSLALAVILFCSLAGLLGYVATSGIAVRTSSSPPVVIDRSVQLESQVKPPEVVVKAQRLPVKEESPEPKPAIVKKAASIALVATRPRHPRIEAPRPIERPAPAVKPQIVVKAPVKQALPKRAVALAEPPPHHEPPREEPKPAETVAKASEPETDRDALQRQIEADREWRRATLARWAKEDEERKAKEREAIHNEFDANGHLRPTDQVDKDADAAYKKDYSSKSKKKGRHRHRFLMIRW